MTTLDLGLEQVRTCPPPRGVKLGAEWDWYTSLPFGHQMDARRFMVEGGMTPDTLATHLATDVDDAMSRWLAAVKVSRGIGSAIVDEWADRAQDDVPALLGMAEVASYLGISRQRIHVLRQEGRFPEPWCVLAQGAIWTGEQIAPLALNRAHALPCPAEARLAVPCPASPGRAEPCLTTTESF
jgi:hypothetical protein